MLVCWWVLHPGSVHLPGLQVQGEEEACDRPARECPGPGGFDAAGRGTELHGGPKVGARLDGRSAAGRISYQQSFTTPIISLCKCRSSRRKPWQQVKEVRQLAATCLQSAFRGFRTRRRSPLGVEASAKDLDDSPIKAFSEVR